MLNSGFFRSPAVARVASLCAAIFLSPALLSGQAIVREALSSLPADTQQLTYLSLEQLRALPDYPQIRQRLLNRQLRDFQDFLRSMGTDPEKDVDEVVAGWRGPQVSSAALFGLAEGRFQPHRVREYFVQNQLPTREYAGLDLYAFGSGEDRADLFFAFLSSSLAAFGRLVDLKALLDARERTRPTLDTNPDFVNWEAELEGTAPQWGVVTGKAAAQQVGPWLAAGGKFAVDPGAFLGSVRAVLYRVEWSRGFSTHVSVICESTESATAFAQLLTLIQASPQLAATNPASGPSTLLRNTEIQANGSRVELNTSGSLEALDPILRVAP